MASSSGAYKPPSLTGLRPFCAEPARTPLAIYDPGILTRYVTCIPICPPGGTYTGTGPAPHFQSVPNSISQLFGAALWPPATVKTPTLRRPSDTFQITSPSLWPVGIMPSPAPQITVIQDAALHLGFVQDVVFPKLHVPAVLANATAAQSLTPSLSSWIPYSSRTSYVSDTLPDGTIWILQWL